MGLQLWLPLNGNLDNQGLSDVTITNSGATVNDSGKIGKCYYFDGTTSMQTTYSTAIGTGDFSIAMWIKIPTLTSATYYAICTSKTNAAASAGFGIYWNHSQKKFLWSTADGSGATEIWMATAVDSIVYDKWIHLVMVRNSNDAKKGYFYINNTRYELASVPPIRNITTDTKLRLGKTTNGSYPVKMYLNDFRIYDHALSPLEVKHLAQGLVLHYPLSDAYIESTTNLITTEDCLSSTCYNAATSKYSYGTNTDIYKTVTTYDGRKGTKVYMGTNGNSCYPYVYVNNMFTSDGSNAPAYKTLSFDYYGTVGNYLGPYKLGSGEGTATYTVTCQGIKTTGTYSNFGGFTVTPNKWNHVEITFHGTTAANSEWGYIRIGNGNHTSNTSNFWFFANMQLEAKDHATGYAGVGGTRTATTVYDTSGFCNNGTINGSSTVSSDTPKYNISTYVNSSSSINHSRCLSNDDQEWTCCAYVKLDGSTSYQQLNNFNNCNMVVYGTTPILYLNGGSDDYYMYGSQVIPVDEWTHIAFVFKNSTGLRNIYINGILKNNYGPNKTSTPSGIPDVVKLFGQNFSGYVSDYREYATALSASDVAELYNAGVVTT